MIKIAIVGSRKYNDYHKIEEVIDKCIDKYGVENICIISGGAVGADALGKIVALDKRLKYIEYNPAHTQWNEWSGKSKEFYNKPYDVKNYFERNSFIAQECDILFAFVPLNYESKGTMHTVTEAKKLNKYIKIIN